MPLSTLEAPNLTERVVAALRERLAAGEFAQGAKLPSEGEIAGVYGVSRTVVREAISQLRASGYVETRRGVGTFARDAGAVTPAFPLAPIDPDALAEVIALLELRISLETETAALAAKRRTQEELRHLEDLLASIGAAAATGGDAPDADFEFHVAVAVATHNHYFADLLRHLGRAMIPRTRIDTAGVARRPRGDYARETNSEHHDVLRAIAAGDSDAARAAMRTHLVNSRERLRGLLGAEPLR